MKRIFAFLLLSGILPPNANAFTQIDSEYGGVENKKKRIEFYEKISNQKYVYVDAYYNNDGMVDSQTTLIIQCDGSQASNWDLAYDKNDQRVGSLGVALNKSNKFCANYNK